MRALPFSRMAVNGNASSLGLPAKSENSTAMRTCSGAVNVRSGRKVLRLQAPTLGADIPVEHEPECLEKICFTRIVLTDEAGDAISDFNIEMP